MYTNEVFEQVENGDENHDVEVLLNTHGLARERYWRVKRMGKNADGSEQWPDLGDGNGTQEFGWVEEKYLSTSDEMIEMRQTYWRNNMHQKQREANEVDGENRCVMCNRMYANLGYMTSHMKWTGKKACPKKSKIRSYKNT